MGRVNISDKFFSRLKRLTISENIFRCGEIEHFREAFPGCGKIENFRNISQKFSFIFRGAFAAQHDENLELSLPVLR